MRYRTPTQLHASLYMGSTKSINPTGQKSASAKKTQKGSKTATIETGKKKK